jgi:hypothetical protein
VNKLSDLIDILAEYRAEHGDLYIHAWMVSDEYHKQESAVLSPDKRDKNGNRKKATHKEFMAMALAERLKALN